MKDEELLSQLRKAAARDPERARAPEWERLAAGAATDDERLAIEAAARAWEDEEAARDLLPIGDEARERIVERVLEARGESVERGERKSEPANVVPLRRKRAIAVVAALAVAASAALAIGLGSRSGDALPAYALAVGGGVANDRGDEPRHPDATLRLGPDSQLDLVLRPERDAVGKIAIAAAIVQASKAEAWDPPHAISSTGAVRIHGDASAIVPGGNGPRDLVIAVGREGALPRDPDAISHLAGGDRVRVFRVHVVVEGR